MLAQECFRLAVGFGPNQSVNRPTGIRRIYGTPILENVRKAMKGAGRVVLLESVIPETRDFDMGKWMDVTMLVMKRGRERTVAEHRELMAKAGFELEQIIPTSSLLSISRISRSTTRRRLAESARLSRRLFRSESVCYS